jgi:hypothetical protein
MVAREYMDDAKVPDAERETVTRRIVDHMEGATEDLACLVMGLMGR